MLPTLNRCCSLCTTIAVGALVVAPDVHIAPHTPITAARAQNGVVDQAADGLPDAADVVRAYTTTRDWLHAFQLPPPDAPEAQVEIAGASAVFVRLRHAGRPVGEGLAGTGESPLLRRAAGRAFGDFLGDPAMRGVPDELRHSVARKLTLELEVAGPLTSVAGRTFLEVAQRIQPGLEGVALRRGDRVVFRFPAQLRERGVGHLSTYLPGLLSELGMTLNNRELQELRQEEALSVYKFRTTHLAQASAKGTPFVTFRGGRIVPESAVTAEGIAQFGADLLAHIQARRWRREGVTIGGPDEDASTLEEVEFHPIIEPLGMFGSYLPALDVYRPLVAPPFEQALTSYALAYYANTPGLETTQVVAASTFARDLLRDLADRQEPDPVRGIPREPDPLDDLSACAMIVLASSELSELLPPPGATRAMIDEAERRVVRAFDADTRAFVAPFGPDGRPQPLLSQEKAQVAAAMARMLADGLTAVTPSVVRAAMDAGWASVEERAQVGLLPWLGWAELDYARATGTMSATTTTRFERFRELLDESQVRRTDPQAPPDLVGGYALRGPFGSEVTAQGLRPAAWRSRLLHAQHGLTGDALAVELGRELGFARFLIQSSVTADSVWAYRNRARALGGVRTALWDSEQPVPAQGLALMVIGDILRGIRRMEGLE